MLTQECCVPPEPSGQRRLIPVTEVGKTGGYLLLRKVTAYEAPEHKFPTTIESLKAIWLLGSHPG